MWLLPVSVERLCCGIANESSAAVGTISKPCFCLLVRQPLNVIGALAGTAGLAGCSLISHGSLLAPASAGSCSASSACSSQELGLAATTSTANLALAWRIHSSRTLRQCNPPLAACHPISRCRTAGNGRGSPQDPARLSDAGRRSRVDSPTATSRRWQQEQHLLRLPEKDAALGHAPFFHGDRLQPKDPGHMWWRMRQARARIDQRMLLEDCRCPPSR